MESPQFNIHHYTDLSAMTSILGKKQIVLRATNVLYLNDSRELLEGIDVVKKLVNRDIEPGAFRNYYLTSFSHAVDNMSMWGMYAANGSGCILSFDHNILSRCYEMIALCSYGQEETEESLRNFLDLTENGCLTNLGGPQLTPEQQIETKNSMKENVIISTCLQAKNEAFSTEKERRGIIHCDKSELVKFRVKNNIVVPYIEIPVPKEALKSITIGPTSNSILTMQSIIHFLMINEYNYKIPIYQSKVPYRG